nr:MAG TPA: hypothetical protein [Caudoviricetes sp.]
MTVICSLIFAISHPYYSSPIYGVFASKLNIRIVIN